MHQDLKASGHVFVICMLEISILPLSTIFLLDFGAVWYFYFLILFQNINRISSIIFISMLQIYICIYIRH
jgi:hypothetical protein